VHVVSDGLMLLLISPSNLLRYSSSSGRLWIRLGDLAFVVFIKECGRHMFREWTLWFPDMVRRVPGRNYGARFGGDATDGGVCQEASSCRHRNSCRARTAILRAAVKE